MLKLSIVKVAQSCLTLWNPTDDTVHGILQARKLEWVAFPFSWESSQPRDRTQVSTLQADYFPAEPQGKPKNTEVSSLSLLQRILPTQESNKGLLHCKQILYRAIREAEVEAPVFWSSDANSRLTGKVPDAGKH